MPNYDFADFRSVTISASRNKLDGQKQRASYNFAMSQLENSSHMMWICPEGVSFDIMKDVTGTDDILYQGVTTGTITPFYDTDSLYIANPHVNNPDVKEDFLITIKPTGYKTFTSWLGDLFGNNPDRTIASINIPGTHDSGTLKRNRIYDGWSCQNVSILTQLESGVRMLDIRLKVKFENNKYKFVICHGDIGSSMEINEFESFVNELDVCVEFLKKYKSEFILMSIQIDDWCNEDTNDKKERAMSELANLLSSKNIGIPFKKNYKYSEVKGKIIFINRVGTYNSIKQIMGDKWKWANNNIYEVTQFGMKMCIQDHYKNISSKEKIDEIRKALKYTDIDLYINFCSGYESWFGVIPDQIDTIEDFLNFLGSEIIVEESGKYTIGWFFFDDVLKEVKLTNKKYLTGVEAIIDSNREKHQFYKYQVQ